MNESSVHLFIESYLNHGALTVGICKWMDAEGKDCEGKQNYFHLKKKHKIIRAKGRSALVPFCGRSCGASPRCILQDKVLTPPTAENVCW